jgi:uncharacterized protein involved in exopolysaccharide biosynthesis
MQIHDNNEEVSILEIILEFKNHFIKILIFTFLVSLVGVYEALDKENVYTSSATIKPAKNSSSTLNSGSSYNSLASLAGINLRQSESNQIGSIVLSRDFFKHLLSFSGVNEALGASVGYDPINGTLIYDEDVFDIANLSYRISEPLFLDLFETYAGVVDVKDNDKTGLINISVTHYSPKFAYEFLSLIIQELNNLSKKRDILETELSLEYLYKQLEDTNQFDIEQAVNQLIETELKTQMYATVKTNYAAEVFDSPFIPIKKSGPNRRFIVLTYAFFSLMVSIIFVLGRYYYNKVVLVRSS